MANVSGHGHRALRGSENSPEKLARRRLSVRARDAEDGVGQQTRTELDLAPDHEPALTRGGRERGRRWNAGAFDEQVHAFEQLGVVRAEDDFDTRCAKPPRIECLVSVDSYDRDAAAGERERRRLARTREAEDERFLRKRGY
jgi:hypothetical protein